MQSITHVSTAVTVKLCHSTVNNHSNRQTLCARNGQQHARCKRSHREVESKREREREREKEKCLLQVCLPPCWLVLVKTAGRASGPGRLDCGRREASLRPPSSLSCDGRLIVGGVALGFGGAELSSVGNCSPTCVLGPAFWAVLSRSCRHCFVAVDVGHPLCGLPWLVVVVVLAMFRFAFVVLSSRLRATQVFPVVVGAGLHAGQVLFPSAWCVLRHHRFVAVFVWESLE